MTTLKQAFQQARKRWGGNGVGSTPAKTQLIQQGLAELVRRRQIRRIVDLGCGDATWILPVAFEVESYVGVDVCPDVIARNQEVVTRIERAAAARAKPWPRLPQFQVIEGPGDQLPQADLVVSRDCLQHLSNDQVWASLEQAGCAAPLLLTTTYPHTGRNVNIAAGGFRPINLQAPPFNLPRPIESLPDSDRKAMALWAILEPRRSPWWGRGPSKEGAR